MKLNNKGFAFSTMLYGTLAVITVVLYAVLSVTKDSVDETYYYGTTIEEKLNECVQDEIDMEKCYTEKNDGSCDPTSYHACLGVSDNPNSSKGTIASEKLKNVITNDNEGLKVDPYNQKRLIYVGENVNNYILYANKLWRIISIEPSGTLRLLDYTANQSIAWDVNGGDNWESSTLASYLNSKYLSTITDVSGLTKGKWFASYVHSSVSPTIGEISDYQFNNNNNQNGAYTLKEYSVGLLSINDYIKATIIGDCHSYPLSNGTCKSWLSGYKGWTIDLDGDVENSAMIYIFTTNDELHTKNATESEHIYPVILLDRNMSIVGGSGTSSDPYRLN